MVTVIFRDNDGERRVDAEPGHTVLGISLRAGLPHYHLCGGQGRCTTCRVLVVEGQGALAPRTTVEEEIAARRGWGPAMRLGCQARLAGGARDGTGQPAAGPPLAVRRLVVDDLDADVISAAPDLSVLPGHDGREALVATLFCDIAGFTGFAADHLPYDVVHVLNRFYREAGEAVLANGGRIDKYLGDGMMALFGLETPAGSQQTAAACLDAVRCALMTADAAASLDRYTRRHFNWPFRVRVGIDLGPVVVGDIGHPEHRHATVIGEAVNAAQRIQDKARDLGTTVLVSGRVADALGDAVTCGQRVSAALKGYEQPRRLVEVLDLRHRDAAFLIQSTFGRLLLQSGDRLVRHFYDALFKRAPAVAPLFAATQPEAQRRMLLNVLRVAVRGCRNPASLAAPLAALGQRHVLYGVRPEHYPVAGQALEDALAATLGEDFTPALRTAWQALFDEVCTLMGTTAATGGPRPAGPSASDANDEKTDDEKAVD